MPRESDGATVLRTSLARLSFSSGWLLLAGGVVAAASAASMADRSARAAALLAAHTPPRPFAMLVGLNVGPNLAPTGSLAWLLWLKSARATGAQPSMAAAARRGVVSVPIAMAGALAIPVAQGHG